MRLFFLVLSIILCPVAGSCADWNSADNTFSGTQAFSIVTGSNFGIGTTFTATSALSVMNGNVGVGTWKPSSLVDVKGTVTAAAFSGPVTGDVTGNVSGTSGSTTGNAATATKLATTRAINGVNFDGSAPITVTADASTLSNTTLAATVVTSSLTSVGRLTSLSTSGNVGVGTVTAPQALYVAGRGFFTTGINIGIGTASATHLCVTNDAVSTCK